MKVHELIKLLKGMPEESDILMDTGEFMYEDIEDVRFEEESTILGKKGEE